MEINRTYPCSRANYWKGRDCAVNYLVIHYVGATGGARANAKYYSSTPGIGASAHYFVGHASEGAAVYSSVPEGDTAWHCGASRYKHPECRNANSIGIEMCCHQTKGGVWYFDPETVDATVELGRDIMGRYGIPITHVLRHYDVTGKICPAPFVNEPEAWEKFKKRLEEPELDEKQIRRIVEDVIAAREAALSAQPVASWAEKDREWAMAQGITDGTRPCSGVTRQEVWAMFHRMETK